MPTVTADTLRDLAARLLEGVGTAPEPAAFIAASLIDANLAGHDSHGVLRLPLYLDAARSGRVDTAVAPTLVKRQGATAVVDAAFGWGQPAMWLATQTAVELAREHGLGAAAVNRCFHIGRVAPYVEEVARNGMVGIAMANAGPAVAPFGGSDRVLGTNPFAWAAPRGGGKPPVCLDVATSAVAEGKLQVARAKGAALAPGLIVDREGSASVDPHDFYDGGALLTFGQHKGSGISMLAQLIGRGLAGMDPSGFQGPRGVNGPFVLAIDVAPFTPLEQFVSHVEATAEAVHGSRPASGFDEVLLPGEPEIANRARRLAEGIPVPDTIWEQLTTRADELGVAVPA